MGGGRRSGSRARARVIWRPCARLVWPVASDALALIAGGDAAAQEWAVPLQGLDGGDSAADRERGWGETLDKLTTFLAAAR